MRILAVTTCVEYDDYLALTLPRNIQHFDETVVVTTKDDVRTQEVCRKNGVPFFISSRIKTEKSISKGKGMNDALEWRTDLDWILHLDADVLLQSDFRKNLAEVTLDPENLYTTQRYEPAAENTEKFFRLLREGVPANKLQRHGVYFLLCHGRHTVSGYFQLFHSSASVLKGRHLYDESSDTVDLSDTRFARRWSKEKRIWLAHWVPVYHLPHGGTYKESVGINWDGRRSKRIDTSTQKGTS